MAELQKPKVLYLFGAGASAGTKREYVGIGLVGDQEIKEYIGADTGIPIVKKLNYALKSINSLLYHHSSSYETSKTEKVESLFSDEFIEDCLWLGSEAEAHGTVDTLAKKLFLIGDNQKLGRLKSTISIFFILLQILWRHDLRYDVFFTSIAQKENTSIMFPKSVVYATWNYDLQIILSLNSMFHRWQLMNHIPATDRIDPDRPSTFFLNGIAGTTGDDKVFDDLIPFVLNRGDYQRYIYELMLMHRNTKTNDYQTKFLIDFAWEASKVTSNSRDLFYKAISEVQTLVCIGYSFPVVNRPLDRNMFQAMPELKKVYVQDCDPDVPIERAKALSTASHEFVPVNDVSQFYIPIEVEI